jgi:hypothetical protein
MLGPFTRKGCTEKCTAKKINNVSTMVSVISRIMWERCFETALAFPGGRIWASFTIGNSPGDELSTPKNGGNNTASIQARDYNESSSRNTSYYTTAPWTHRALFPEKCWSHLKPTRQKLALSVVPTVWQKALCYTALWPSTGVIGTGRQLRERALDRQSKNESILFTCRSLG